MKDGYARNIDYLRLSVTDRCNLRCQYCMPPEGVVPKRPDEILSYEELALIGKVAINCGLTKIRLTGGEPLVRKDLTSLVRYLASNPELTDLALTTNGTQLREHARPLREAGLRRVNISIDTLDVEQYRWLTRGGNVAKVLDGVEAALEAGLRPVKINVVALRPLAKGFVEIAKLIHDHYVHVRFIEHMPVGKGSFTRIESYISTAEIMAELSQLGKLEPGGGPTGWGPARYYSIKGAKGTVGFISPESGHFCGTCNRLRVTADGHLKSCLFMSQGVDLKPYLRGEKPESALLEVFKLALVKKPKERPGRTTEGQMSQIGG